MTNALRASIIIPTHNRASVLPLCLEAVAALETDPANFEIIIVDNNSTDHTRDVCLAFAAAHPTLGVRYVFEPTQGASHARNRGIVEACGEILCFLDDDSPPDSNWFENILSPFNDPEVGCTGGPVALDLQGYSMPAWLQGDLQGLLSGYGLPYTQPTRVSKWEQYPLSTNMAIRKQVLVNLNWFRTDLGRSGRGSLAGEETELIHRINKSGWKVIYVPNARVRHLIPPERLNKAYIYRVGYGLAATHVILTYDVRLFRIIRWFASDMWYATRMCFRWIVALLQRKPLWFDDYMRFWMVAMRIPLRIQVLVKGQTSVRNISR